MPRVVALTALTGNVGTPTNRNKRSSSGAIELQLNTHRGEAATAQKVILTMNPGIGQSSALNISC